MLEAQQHLELDVTAIVCTCNRADTLPATLKDLAVSQLPDSISWEILVVDNNSIDGTREVVESVSRIFPGRFRYVFEPRPGKSNALNTGIANARGAVLAFVDDDVMIEPKWLQNLTAQLHSSQWAGAAGRILPAQSFVLPAWLSWKDCGGVFRPDPRGILYGHFDLGDHAIELNMHQVPYGANMAIRRQMFEKYGGFRTDLGPGQGRDIPRSNEDRDISHRLIKAGERMRYEPAAIVYHPVREDRFNKNYHLSYWFDFGKSSIVERGEQTDVYGIPRDYFSLVRQLMRGSLMWLQGMLTTRPNKKFFCQCMTQMHIGMAVELHRRLNRPRGTAIADTCEMNADVQ